MSYFYKGVKKTFKKLTILAIYVNKKYFYLNKKTESQN
jgi:hypothetical protein